MKKKPVIIGHRGARANFPENTLQGFTETLRKGISHLELDVVISGDSKLVVSHEPWMSFIFCSKPDGKPVRMTDQGNLYQMKYSGIRKYDCGSRKNRLFPEQKNFHAVKPLLADVFKECEKINSASPPEYLVELKSREEWYKKFQPDPEEYAKLVSAFINKAALGDRLVLQSFDIRLLKQIKKILPEQKLGFLPQKDPDLTFIRKTLGSFPFSVNPNYRFLSRSFLEECRNEGIKVFTWTVNGASDLVKTAKSGVDGIITDEPFKALQVIGSL